MIKREKDTMTTRHEKLFQQIDQHYIELHLFIRRIQRDFFRSANAKKCNSVRVSQREATVDQLRGWSEVKKVS